MPALHDLRRPTAYMALHLALVGRVKAVARRRRSCSSVAERQDLVARSARRRVAPVGHAVPGLRAADRTRLASACAPARGQGAARGAASRARRLRSCRRGAARSRWSEHVALDQLCCPVEGRRTAACAAGLGASGSCRRRRSPRWMPRGVRRTASRRADGCGQSRRQHARVRRRESDAASSDQRRRNEIAGGIERSTSAGEFERAEAAARLRAAGAGMCSTGPRRPARAWPPRASSASRRP